MVPKGWPVCRRHGVQTLLHVGRKGLQSLGAEVGGVPALPDTKYPTHFSLHLWKELVHRMVFLPQEGHLENKMPFYSLN